MEVARLRPHVSIKTGLIGSVMPFSFHGNNKALYQDLEVWEYLNRILKESNESLNLWTIIEKRVCSERTPSISNILDILRTPDSFGEHPWNLKRIVLLRPPLPF
jgi:hypothetical protein